MVKVQAVEERKEQNSFAMDGELCLLMVPLPTYEALTREATKRQLTLAQFLAAAVDAFITPSGGHSLPPPPPTPTLAASDEELAKDLEVEPVKRRCNRGRVEPAALTRRFR